MATNVSNLVLGTATIYAGAVGATEPVDAVAAPAVAWTDLGATTDGVTLTVNQEFTELEADQIVDIPGSRLIKRSFTIETNLAELTLDNLKLALNGGTVTTVAGKGTYTPTVVATVNEPVYTALLIDGAAPNGKRRRIIVRKALSTDDIEFAYNKEDQAVYSVSFTAHYVSGTVAPFVVIDEQ